MYINHALTCGWQAWKARGAETFKAFRSSPFSFSTSLAICGTNCLITVKFCLSSRYIETICVVSAQKNCENLQTVKDVFNTPVPAVVNSTFLFLKTSSSSSSSFADNSRFSSSAFSAQRQSIRSIKSCYRIRVKTATNNLSCLRVNFNAHSQWMSRLPNHNDDCFGWLIIQYDRRALKQPQNHFFIGRVWLLIKTLNFLLTLGLYVGLDYFCRPRGSF